MFAHRWLKNVLILLTLIFLCGWALQMDAWARAGGSRSMGSRGSRSAAPPKPYVAPTTPKPSQPSPTPTGQVTPTPRPTPAPAPQPSSFMRSFGGGLLGGLAGGLLFSTLFGGGAHAGGAGGLGGSGISLVEILLMAGIAYLVYRYIRNRRRKPRPQPAIKAVWVRWSCRPSPLIPRLTISLRLRKGM